jgi:signal transduction histidine kinase
MNKIESIKILCLEDEEIDAILIRERLKSDGLVFDFDLAATESEYTRMLMEGGYDLILSDFNLPGYNGIAALVQAKELYPDIPFICISGTIGEDLAVELIQMGAADYILKDRLSRLSIAIGEALHKAEAERARKKAEEEIINMKKALELLNHHLDEIREEERAAISREIHDNLGQSLTALKIDLNHLREKVPENSDENIKLGKMSDLVTEIIKDVQRIAAELRPPILDDLGLASAMEWYIHEFQERTGIQCDINLAEVQFPVEKKNLTIYRILQEGLTNVSRHSMAKMVSVRLDHSDNIITLRIADNGVGLENSKISSFSSLGFIGIRERLKAYNGTLEIISSPGQGTILNISIPFN